MADTYFATFCLGDGEHPPALEDVLAELRRWLTRPRQGIDLAKLRNADLLASGTYEVGDGQLVVRRAEDDTADLVGIRLRHPDAGQSDVEWMSEVVLANTRTGTAELRASIRTSLRRVGSVVAPIQTPASRPRLVSDLISRFGAYDGGFKLVTTALPVTAIDFDKYFLEALEHSHRTVPLVVVTSTGTDEHLVNPDVLAEQLAGVALVCSFQNRFVGWRLTSRLGKDWSCWDGGIRVYWPLPRLTQPPNGHVVLSRRRIEELGTSNDVAVELLGMVSRAATSRSAVGIAKWSEIENRASAKLVAAAKERGDNAELLRLVYEEKERLADEKASLEKQLLDAWGDLERARQDATYWRKEYEVARRSVSPSSDASEPPAPSSVAEALQQVAQMFPERLEVHANSSSDEHTPFEDVESLAKALRFLATTYVDARSGKRSCNDLDAAVRTTSGFFYKAGQSEITMGQFKNEYEATWNGRKIKLEEHIGKGTGRDPRRSIRLGFYYDRESQKVVIGYVGQHQTTGAS